MYKVRWAVSKGSNRKIQSRNIFLHQESNQLLLAFQRVASNYSATLTVKGLLLKRLQFFGISINACNNVSMKLIMGLVYSYKVR